MRFVVDGEDDRSGGLVGCHFAPRPGSYDHKRHHAAKQRGEPVLTQLRVWDFVIERADNSAVRLHPNWSSTKVETYEVDGHLLEVQPPAAGLGCSDGRGTHKFYKEQGTQRKLKFAPLRTNFPQSGGNKLVQFGPQLRNRLCARS